MSTLRFSAMIVIAGFLAASGASAQQKPHEHGHWQLNAAVEGSELHMEVFAPGANVVGFEHQAETAEDKAKVEAAIEKLEAGETLFVLTAAAGCSLKDAHAAIAGDDHDDHDDHGSEKHHGHADAHKDDHDKHDDHKDDHHKHDDHKEAGHDKHDGDEESHNEFHAEYVFECNDVAKLAAITVNIFEAFPTTEEIEATVLTEKGQRAAELEPGKQTISLEGLL